MFERFTEKAIRVVMLSQEESRRMAHNHVGSEQVLLGLLSEGTGLGWRVLRSAKFTLKETRAIVEKVVGRGMSGGVPGEIPFTPRSKRVLEHSIEESRDLGHGYVGTEHLLLALLDEDEGGAIYKIFEEKKASMSRLKTDVLIAIGSDDERNQGGREAVRVTGRESEDFQGSLDDFSSNLTEEARNGELDPVVGRVKEIERVVQILVRRKKNNPVLIGEPGVGKTAVAEGLAQRIIQRDVPDILEDREIISLDIGLLLAGTKFRGEFEERIKCVMDEVEARPEIVLVIDEVHNLIGAGAAEGSVDAANILKPALARGGLQCIGATTIEEYRKHIEKDAALERRFQPVKIPEPTVEETIEILRGLRSRYEKHHLLKYTDESLVAASKFGAQFIADRFLPDKAIDLLDEAGARVRLLGCKLSPIIKDLDKELRDILLDKDDAIRANEFEEAGMIRSLEMEVRRQIAALLTRENGKRSKYDPTVTESHVADIVAAWTGIPVTKVARDEKNKLVNIEKTLHEKVIGQENAVTAIAKAIRRSRTGLKNPNRPIASFLFSGPTGVGKTELTKVLASYFFGSVESTVRMDMSEYMERHSVSKLIGSPPGYVGFSEGGLLTEQIRRKPYSVVLFDEAEKAHPDIFNLLLQILEDGRLTDAQGRLIDFRNTLLILTSNIGSSEIMKNPIDTSNLAEDNESKNELEDNFSGSSKNELDEILQLGFESISSTQELNPSKNSMEQDKPLDPEYARIYKVVQEALKGFFKPEFLNRLDEVIVFKPLSMPDVDNICTIMLNQLEERVVEQGFTIEVDSLAKAVLTKAGYDPFYGARPLRRAIMNLLEDKLAELFLTDNLVPGNHIHVTALNDVIDIKIEKEAPLKLNLSDEDSQKLEDVKTKTRRKFVTSKDLSSIGT